VDELLCLTVLSQPGESEADFGARLSRFWTHLLRSREDDFEKVYAETTRFERQGERWSRQYLFEEAVADLLETELRAAGLDFAPLDRDDLYSKYEAVSPEWMQIEH
jgi:hypothetical protein